jgi:importin subunit beta-1
LDGQFKEQLKMAILSCLATPQLSVRRQVSRTVAIIASIEIPRKEWLDLITNLSTNASHESFDIRYAALETLGFICEEISPSDLSQELKNQVV